MNPELGLSLVGVGLLVVAAAGRSLAWSGVGPVPRTWDRWLLLLRAAAAGVLAAALALGLAGHSMGMPLAALQVAQAIALASLLVQLGSRVWYRFDGAGPVADFLALALVAVGLAVSWPSGYVLDCAQCTVPAQVQGVLFLIGAGGATVMGAAGLALPLRALLLQRNRAHLLPGRPELCGFIQAVTALTLVLLGCGLLVGLWWTWRALGSLVGNDLRWGWMAAAWLLTLISWLSWPLARCRGPVVVTFGLLAAVTANLGLLAAQQLQHWLGF